MRGVIRDMTDAAVLGADYLLHALLDTHATDVLLVRIYDRDGVGGLVICTVESVEVRCRLRFLFDLGLSLDRCRAPRVALREKPVGCISQTGGCAGYASTSSIGFHIF